MANQKWNRPVFSAPKRGRPKGAKSVKKVDGGFVNQYCVYFSAEQKKALDRAVDRSNYRRTAQLKAVEAKNPRHKELRTMGKEGDFIIPRQSKSLQEFKSLDDFTAFMDKQKRIQSGEFLEDMTRLYKKNYMAALDNTFGAKAAGIKMRVRMMKPEDFRRLVEEKGEDMEIGYIYDLDAANVKLHRIRELLGMKQVEPDIFSDPED